MFNLLLGSIDDSDAPTEEKSHSFWIKEIEPQLYKHFILFPGRSQLIKEYEEDALDIETRMLNAAAASICTFSVTGWEFAVQSYYTCYT
jgi:hypothetical protein